MSESVFLAANGELEGSAADGGDEEVAGDVEGRCGRSCGCFVGVEQSAEVRMGTERGSEEGGAAAAAEEVHGEWWCDREAICGQEEAHFRNYYPFVASFVKLRFQLKNALSRIRFMILTSIT